MHESEADAFGLDAAREPDGFAGAAMKVASYRKIAPGPLEEMLFFIVIPLCGLLTYNVVTASLDLWARLRARRMRTRR